MLFKFTFTSCNIIVIIIRMAFGIMWLPFNTVEYYKICFVIVSSTSSQFLQDKSMPIYPGWSLNDVTLLKRGEILMILKHGRRSKIWNMCNAILYDFKRKKIRNNQNKNKNDFAFDDRHSRNCILLQFNFQYR